MSDKNNPRLTQSPIFSIIIPIYNAEKYIRQSIESTLHQSFSDIEIICVDDKSTDGTIAIIEDYMRADKRIRLLRHERNMGELKSRCTGVSSAKGQYLMFLDPDDEFELYACEKLYSVTKQHKADIYGFSVKIVCPFEKIRKREQKSHKTYGGYLHGLDIMRKSFIDRENSWLVTDKMFAAEPCKKAYEHIGDCLVDLEISPVGPDCLALMVIAYFSESYYGIDDYLYRYHYGRGINDFRLISMKDFERYCICTINVECCRRFFSQQGVMQQHEEFINALHLGLFATCINVFFNRVASEDREEALRLMMRYWPISDLVTRLGLTAAACHSKSWEVPFNSLPKGGRIILYGAGDMGRDYYRQITDSEFCEIVLWVDKNYRTISKKGLNVSSPHEIENAVYDGVLIAVSDYAIAHNIEKYLLDSLNVQKNLIIQQDPL